MAAPVLNDAGPAVAKPPARSWRWLLGVFAATRALCLAGLAVGGHRVAGGGGLGTALISGAWHWDAHWYTSIVLQGYSFTHGAGSNVAFFPAAPLLIWLGTHLLGHPVAAGMAISVIESAVASVLMVRVMEPVVGATAARRGVILLLCWPTSMFFVVPYADGLLLLSAVATFALAQRQRDVAAGLAGAVGALTRSTGFFLALPLALFIRSRRGATERRTWLAGIVGVGTAVYAFGLLLMFREPLGFASAEAAGWHRVALPPPLPVAYTIFRVLTGWQVLGRGRPDLFLADILDLASIAVVAYALWTNRRRVPAPYLAWPAVGLLWPLLTGTTSVGRYTLVLFPAFALFAGRLSDRQWRWVVGGSLSLMALTAYTFGAGGWVG